MKNTQYLKQSFYFIKKHSAEHNFVLSNKSKIKVLEIEMPGNWEDHIEYYRVNSYVLITFSVRCKFCGKQSKWINSGLKITHCLSGTVISQFKKLNKQQSGGLCLKCLREKREIKGNKFKVIFPKKVLTKFLKENTYHDYALS